MNVELKNIEKSMLKRIYKNKILHFYNDEYETCQKLQSKGLVNRINENGSIGFAISDKGIVYIETARSESIKFIIEKILIPFIFFILGAIATNIEKVVNFISKVLNTN